MFDTTTNVTTRGGRPARIVTTALDDETYPIGALVQNEDGTEEFETYTKTGAYSTELPDHRKDLVVVPETTTHFLSMGHGYTAFRHAVNAHDGEWPILKVVVERGTNRLVSSEIATA